jgi:1-acyl-sn-glycerol-3-phosphate acyltransferase
MDSLIRVVFGYAMLLVFSLFMALLLAVGSLVLPLIWLFIPADKRKRIVRRLISRVFDIFLRTLCWCNLMQLDLSSIDKLAKEERLIIAVNHPSLLDALFIVSRLPNASCIMKYSLMANPLLGFGARMAGYIRNDSTQVLVRGACDDLAAGSQLVVFPEGTRTVELPINELRGAYATIARRSKVPVQLVMINSNSRFLGKRWPLLKRPDLPLRYQATVLERIDPNQSREAIVAQTNEHFRDAIGDTPFDLNGANNATEPRLNPSH